MNNQYQICNRCVLDTTEPSITFDANGVCHFCNEFDDKQALKKKTPEEKNKQLLAFIEKIKKDGKGKEYDCIIGLSGGVDSSYVAYLVKKVHGLRPLAVHLDNGWNDELAVKNIENICKILDIDLYTHVINWEEFKDLQLSFLKASVANAEAPTDHAIFATLFKMALKYKIKWIVDGVNEATEYTRKGTKAAGYRYDDLTQIKGIHKIFGKIKLKTFPLLSIYKKYILREVYKIRQFSILNFGEFNKEEAKKLLIKELNWKEYGAKHHESLFTKWHQVVYLPKKFGFDKRRLHLSDLILSGQISRENALLELERPALDLQKTKDLENYVTKKLSLTEDEYKTILELKPQSYSEYPNDERILSFYLKMFKK